MSNTPAMLLLFERRVLEHGFIEVVVWRLARPVRGVGHLFKYRLAYVVDGKCVLRYDNEPGKGDHRHVGSREEAYAYVSVDQLLNDFLADVGQWMGRCNGSSDDHG